MKSMNFIKRATVTAMAVLCFSIAANADNKLYFKDFKIVPGVETSAYLYLDYDNSDLGGFQCEISLPEGLSFVKFPTGANKMWICDERNYNKQVDGYDPLYFSDNTLDDGTVRILCGNISAGAGVPIKGSSGQAIVECYFIADNNFVEGTIYVKNGKLSDTKGSAGSVICTDTTATITADTETSVEETLADVDANAEYYNLQGVKVAKENLTQGVYIKKVGGKSVKVLIK